MSETGVVKFRCDHIAAAAVRFAGFDELNRVRQTLYGINLIGVDERGIGFGNLSVRGERAGEFYISGSGTGALPELDAQHYSKVVAYDFDASWLNCEGAVIASSESLTHAAIYEASPEARAVIHCHSSELWKSLSTATSADVEYGTPEMAREVVRLFRETNVAAEKLFAMHGHESGVIAFGASPADAATALLSALRVRSS